jgi:hypothetical protein
VSNIRDIPYKDGIYYTLIKIVPTVDEKSPRHDGRQQQIDDNKQNEVKDRIRFLFSDILYDYPIKPINRHQLNGY